MPEDSYIESANEQDREREKKKEKKRASSCTRSEQTRGTNNIGIFYWQRKIKESKKINRFHGKYTNVQMA